ncbi:MAG: ATP-binding cassette domain-containing protein [Sphingobacteriales bacterium]|nr:MAG: ATP-binding cassette domain-containing protein [Sphingobacteriales bacterium]
MKILLTDAGKRYNREWIFRHLTQVFETGQCYAITGHNGSGKSTLLQVVAGAILPNEGKLVMTTNSEISTEEHYKHVSITAPYLELVEEMTAREFLDFHRSFKPFLQNMSLPDVLNEVELSHAADKQIRYFSSGMKQRLKLAQGILSDTAFVLLDEPCTNLDETGIRLYQRLINTYTQDRCVIVSSNDQQEYGFCKISINIQDYK